MKVRSRASAETADVLVVNPFVSEEQRKACFAKDDPDWDCREWEAKTPSSLPRKKKARKAAMVRNRRERLAKQSGKSPPSTSGAGSKGARNPLRFDPTRTITLRRAFSSRLSAQLTRLRMEVVKLVRDEDAFGLRERRPFSVNVFCPTGAGGGVDATCSPSGTGRTTTRVKFSKASLKEGKEAAARWKARAGEGLTAFVDKIPGGKPVRTKLHALKEKMEARYGKKTVGRIILASNAISWGAFVAGPLVGHPNYLPVEGLMAVGAALAEAHYQIKARLLSGGKKAALEPATNVEQLDYAGIVEQAEVLMSRLGEAWRRWQARGQEAPRIMQSPAENSFCPTGEGGGVDPSCSPQQQDMHSLMKRAMADAAKQSGTKDTSLESFCEPFAEELARGLNKQGIRALILSYESKTEPVSHTFVRASLKGIGLRYVDASGLYKSKEDLLEAFEKTNNLTPSPAWDLNSDPANPTRNMADNSFCPTGQGGGVDPSCSSASGVTGTSSAESGILSKIEGVQLPDRDGEIRTGGKDVAYVVNPTKAELAKLFRQEGILRGIADSERVLVWPESQAQHQQVQMALGNEETASFYLARNGTVEPSASGGGNEDWTGDWPAQHPYFKRFFPKPTGYGTVKLSLNELTESGNDLSSPAINVRWAFHSGPEQVKAFQEWLKHQLRSTLLSRTQEELWRRYVEEGFRKGAGRAFDDTKPLQRPELYSEESQASLRDFYRGSKDEFLRSSFAQPESVDKVKLMAGRAFDDLEGVTSDMSLKMSRVLTDGLVQGQGPAEIARQLSREVDLAKPRAMTIARTELIRAHAEGQLTALEKLGVEEVGVAVEWSTAGDDHVCELCQPLEGVVLKIDEARGLLPRHPNCFVSPKVPIYTADGWKSLGDVVVGDLVLTHKGRFRKVIQLHRNAGSGVVVKFRIAYGGTWHLITVTGDHPVMVNKVWKAAKDIKIGDKVRWMISACKNHDGEHRFCDFPVVAVSSEEKTSLRMYNLSVEEDESYIAKGCVVHNCRCAFIPANVGEDDEGQKDTKAAIDDAMEESGLEDADVDDGRPESVLNWQEREEHLWRDVRLENTELDFTARWDAPRQDPAHLTGPQWTVTDVGHLQSFQELMTGVLNDWQVNVDERALDDFSGMLLNDLGRFFADCERDEHGRCLPAGDIRVDVATLKVARKLALARAAAASRPPVEEVAAINARIDRLGADRYESQIRGNSKDRAASRSRMLREFGDGTHCPCTYCGTKLTDSTLTRDKILTAREGGRYRNDNLIPACLGCNQSRGDVPFSSIKWSKLS